MTQKGHASFGDEILVYHNAQESHGGRGGRDGGYLNANLSKAEAGSEKRRRKGSPLRDLRSAAPGETCSPFDGRRGDVFSHAINPAGRAFA